MKGNVTNTGYWPDSPDRNNDFNIIPSNEITMEGMDMPLMGISNKGDKKLMMPGKNYKFKGETVMETPVDKGMFLGRFKQVGGQLVPHDISVPNLSRQQGGSNFKTKLRPEEEQQFKQFYQTLPGNLREDDASYDTRGYWDASGRPSEFDYSQPTDEDGYYHAFSRHPETGKILKSPGHPTFKYAVDKTPIEGNTYIPTVGVDGNVYMRDLNQDSENLQRQDGGAAKRFNTNLRGAQREAFNQHTQQFPSLATDTGDYDTQGFYKEVYNKNNGDMNAITAALTPGSPTAHVGNDRYKKPNHPTFSKESKYHIPVLRPAGEWGRNDQGDYFNAARRNIKNMTESDGTPLDYFKRAEDYNQNGVPDTQLLYRGKSMFNTDAPAYELPEMKPSKLEYSGGGSVKRVKIKSLPNNWKSQ